VADLPTRDGAQHLHFEVGPIDINPGQNNIDYTRPIPQPEVDGWIVKIRPDLRLADGSVPPVDVVHLHHGVWLNGSKADATAGVPERIFAAGEEKTITALPAPYGYQYSTSDKWILNFMLHDLLPDPTQVWITYDIDFIPADAPEAAGIVPARPIWMDVQNGSVYPVFDVIRGEGTDGTFTYPDQADDPYQGGTPLNQWTVDRDGVLIATAGHLHPGGLHTDLWVTRGDQTAHAFRSDAQYFEPAGAVSWDVAMTATTPDWHVAVQAGDVLSTTATYDSALASWYESMGIMVVWMGEPGGAADDPFEVDVATPGILTHGHLAENDNHGGQPDASYVDMTKLPSAPASDKIEIEDFVYGEGDMSFAATVPTVRPGGTIEFDNLDAPLYRGLWHTITSCAAPCNASTGIAFPIADGPIAFDSGELGTGGPPTAERTTWSVPTDLPEGTYTYFCRIHPLMRGAFRVEGDPVDGASTTTGG
jgi:plastocyanin